MRWSIPEASSNSACSAPPHSTRHPDETPRDAKITGFGRIDGRDVGVVINDFTVKGSSTSATNSRKMGYIRRTCTERGLPFVHIGESTGARLPDAMGSKGMGQLLGNDITQFRRTRETPWAAAALDTSFGSSAWQCCCADFSVMKKGSIMAVSSPRLVSMAIGQKVDLEELGGWRLHAEQTGLIDYFVDTDAEAMASIRRFLSYMPSHHRELPPARAGAGRIGRGPGPAARRRAGEANAGLQHEEGGRDHGRSRQLLRDQGAIRPAGDRGTGAARRPQRRHHRQQSRGRRRRSVRGSLPQDRRFHGAVRQLQHSAHPHDGHARLRGRPRRRAPRRARATS